MNKIRAYLIGFSKILIILNNVNDFHINNLSVSNGNKIININSYNITKKASLLLFLHGEISLKNFCFIDYRGEKIKVIYKYLFNTSEFNKRYYYEGDLGLFYSKSCSLFKVWSPAASSLSLLLYKNADSNVYENPLEIKMKEGDYGVWSTLIQEDLKGCYYTYKVSVYGSTQEAVDPYAKAVSINGFRAAVIDLLETNPENWLEDKLPVIEHYTDAIIYEGSIRDLSMHPESGISFKGKYLGLTEKNTFGKNSVSTGFSHIKELGITHLQLMPFFQFSYRRVDEKNPMKYSWGYDPENYNVPEGSFSLNPYSPNSRILELKKMIMHFHANNIAINMDVVYNHLFHKTDNNLEKIFPGYYFRTEEDESFSNGSGCSNDTASERKMMRKFIVDSVFYWAKEYHMDGFRFDLMGLHDIQTMNSLYNKLKELGRKIMLYGEGWDLNTPLPKSLKSIQKNSHKIPHIGFFNDTIRDAVKGNVFNWRDKGFVSGKENLEDLIKYCVMASSVPYKIYRAIYSSPEQAINYTSCHDNHTLWDKLCLSNEWDSPEDRKHMLKLANAIILTSQGVPFIHSGAEFCRTKELLDNSFSSPDYINNIDYNRKAEFIDVFNYYKGLIAIRKEHPLFRMYNSEDIKENLHFLDCLNKNTVAFILKDKYGKDSWNNILVIYNPNKFQVTIDVPYNRWHLVANKHSANLTPLSVLVSNKITVDSLCMSMYYSKE